MEKTKKLAPIGDFPNISTGPEDISKLEEIYNGANRYLVNILKYELGNNFPIFNNHIQNNDLGSALLRILFQDDIKSSDIGLLTGPLIYTIDKRLEKIDQSKIQVDIIDTEFELIQNYYNYLSVEGYLNSEFSATSLKDRSESNLKSIRNDISKFKYASALRYLLSMPKPYEKVAYLVEYNNKNYVEPNTEETEQNTTNGETLGKDVYYSNDPSDSKQNYLIKVQHQKVKFDRRILNGKLGISIHHINAMGKLATEIDNLLNP